MSSINWFVLFRDTNLFGILAGSSYTPFTTVKDPTSTVTNHTTQAPPTDGSTVFLLGQCLSGCIIGSPVDLTLDLSSINTTFTLAFTDQTWSLAILTCLPNITIATREVRNDGHGVLSVQPRPAGTQLTRQGNLNPIQTTALFSIATMSLPQGAGALSGTQVEYVSLGTQVQGNILFGQAQFESLPGSDAPQGTVTTLTPAPIEDITQGYTQVIRSAAKCTCPTCTKCGSWLTLCISPDSPAYLAGYLGTAYVPGRISTSEIVFAASIPNLAVASAVFALLAAVIVLAHFRRGKGVGFTLVNVAAAVHESELPALFARAGTGAGQTAVDVDMEAEADVGDEATETAGTAGMDEARHVGDRSVDECQGHIMETLGERRVFMQKRADGSPVLHMES